MKTPRQLAISAAATAVLVIMAGLTAPGASARAALPSSNARHRLADHGSKARAGWSSVTVQLAASDPVALSALRSSHLRGPARKAAVLAAAPSEASRSAVTTYARGAGLTVTSQTPFAVTLSGPSASVANAFPMVGTVAGKARGVTASPAAHRASPLRVPKALQQYVTAVVGGPTSTGGLLHPLSLTRSSGGQPAAVGPALTPGLLTGSSARALYSVPTAATTSPGFGITVATLQFSGWNESNLTTFAASVGLPDPVASLQYQGLSVDGASPATPDGTDGDIEVALDQETLYTVAPGADQVAYFAPNTDQGFVDAFEAVANDALTNTAGLNYTAMSVSWGLCEALMGAPAMNAISVAVSHVVAAGVTVFASSGDQGAFDCSTPAAPVDSLAVDYPASDPNVIGVGGLTTDPVTHEETTWWTPTGASSPAYLGQGGGGGQSQFFAQPSWQVGRYPSATLRTVPDISLDADPASGMLIRAQGTWIQEGGTSLAAPLAAATLTDEQIALGADTDYGLGVITPNLYAAPAASFRDTTTGSNGFFNAGTGYDLATGLGAPLWSRLGDAVAGSPTVSAPAVSASRNIPVSVTIPTGMSYIGFKSGVGTGTEPPTCDATGSSPTPPTTVTAPSDGPAIVWVLGYITSGNCFLGESPTYVDTAAPGPTRISGAVTPVGSGAMTWVFSASDPAPSSGATFHVTVTRMDTGAVVYSHATSSSKVSVPGLPGVQYRASVQVTDAAGHASSVSSAHLTMPLSVSSLKLTRGWAGLADNGAVRHRAVAASAKTASASIRTTGAAFYLYGLANKAGGIATVYIDGRKVASWSLYSKVTRPGSALKVAAFPHAGLHTIVVRVTGTHARGATGSKIILEGILAAR